ncbi:MAG TPA: sulfatase-like hydrolase/transferase, partial [Pirellulales bacterium]
MTRRFFVPQFAALAAALVVGFALPGVPLAAQTPAPLAQAAAQAPAPVDGAVPASPDDGEKTAPKPTKTIETSANERPNVILIVTDDHRADGLSCAGHPLLKTPHLDAIAARGVRFSNAFCTTAICAVSRASILTGQYARRHGIHDFKTGLSEPQWAASLPGVLKAAGYRTGFVGKWGVGDVMPKDKFDRWNGFPGQGRYYEPSDVDHAS